MSLQVLRKKQPILGLGDGNDSRWLFGDRDYCAEENAPILVVGPDEAQVSRYLGDPFARAGTEAGVVVVVFSPESPGGIMEALAEALHALFPEFSEEPPAKGDLARWAMAVHRAAGGSRVDLQRRLLVVDGLAPLWKGPGEEQILFAETLQQLARQRSIAVVIGAGREDLKRCAQLPGLSHAQSERDLVPIICRPRTEVPLAQEPVFVPPQESIEESEEEIPGEGGSLRGLPWKDWRIWGPALGMAGIALIWSLFFRPYVPVAPGGNLEFSPGVERAEPALLDGSTGSFSDFNPVVSVADHQGTGLEDSAQKGIMEASLTSSER